MSFTSESTTGGLAGRKAVITGGARGLGLAIAKLFAAAGGQVTVIDLPYVLEHEELPMEVRSFSIDLSGPDAEARLSDLAGSLGPVDVLVANAGLVPPWRRIADLDQEEWNRVFAVNVWGVAATLKALKENLVQATRASVVLMASINGYKAHPDQTLYTASKHAVIGIMRAAAQDLGRDGIRVNALAPGPIPTSALLERIDARAASGGLPAEVALATLADESFLGDLATPEMVANAALFLAEDQSAGITGTVLPVTRGLA